MKEVILKKVYTIFYKISTNLPKWLDVKSAIKELKQAIEDLIQTLQLKESSKSTSKLRRLTEKRKKFVLVVSEL